MKDEMYKDLIYRISEEEKKQDSYQFVIPLDTIKELNEEQKLDLFLRAIKYYEFGLFKIWVGVSGGYSHLSFYMEDIIEKYRLLFDEDTYRRFSFK